MNCLSHDHRTPSTLELMGCLRLLLDFPRPSLATQQLVKANKIGIRVLMNRVIIIKS